MEDGLLSLKWNNHRSTFFHILSEVRGKHTYTDATLACEGKFYPVHKLVMSTCSDYFAEIFEKTPCKNPVVVLKDIKKSDLDALLDYMYIGEVDVRQSELAGLIKAAECLRIKGLAVPDEDPTKTQKKGSNNVPERREDSPPAKRKRRESGGDRGRPPSPVHRGPSQSSSHSPSSSSVPSQAPQLSSVPESHVPSQSMPPPPTIPQETRNLDGQRGRESHSQSSSQQSHSPAIPSLRPSPDPTSLRSPSGLDASQASSTSPRSSESSSILPVQKIKVEVDDGGDSSARDSHPDRDEGNEIDGEDEDASNEFSEYQSQGGEIEKEEHDQMESYGADQIPGPSGLQGGPPMLSWGEEGDAGFPHNLFGGDDPAAQQAVDVAHVPQSSAGVMMVDGREIYSNQWSLLNKAIVAGSLSDSGGLTSQDGYLHERMMPFERELYQCPYCPYSAKINANLKSHIRTHTGEKPFACPHCSYKTAHSPDLKKHIRRHTGEKPYACPYCPYRTVQNSTLTTHIRTHTRERPTSFLKARSHSQSKNLFL